MTKTLARQMFRGMMAIGVLALLMLASCKPETGQSPLATPEEKALQNPASTNSRPTPLPVTPWPTATLLPDQGVRTTQTVEIQPAAKQNWKRFAFLASDGHALVASVEDGTGKTLPVAINLETKQAEVLDQNPNHAWIHDVHTSNLYTVWIASLDQQDTLYMRNTQTGQTSSVVGEMHRIALSGNVVVGEQLGDNWNIWGYDIVQNKSFPIVTRKDDQTGPLISGRWVVYRDAADKDDIGIGLYVINLDTGKDIRLGSVYASSTQYVPPLYAINAPWVAWGTGQWSTQPELHLYNLDTSTPYTITVASCSFREQAGRPQHLLISGSLLLFNGCYQDLGYDIEKKVFFSLPTYTPEMQGSSWAGWSLSGDQLIWIRSSGPYGQEESHIYTARIVRDK
jgi:hypothetical protein